MKISNISFGILLLFLLSLGQLQRIEVAGLGIYIHDLVISGWLAMLLVQYRKQLLKKILTLWPRIRLPFFIVCFWILLGWSYHFLTEGLTLIPFAYFGRLLTYLSLAGILLWKKIFQEDFFKDAIDIYSYVLIILGWFQFIVIPDTRWLSILGWDDHYFRLLGTQFDPNFYGLLLVIFIWWWMLAYFRKSSWGLIVLSALALSLIFTWSRASYLSLLLSLGLVPFIKTSNLRKFVATGLIVFILIGGIFFTPKPSGEGGNLQRTTSIQNRVEKTIQTTTAVSIPEQIIGDGLFTTQKNLETTDFIRSNHAKLADSLFISLWSGIGWGGVILLGLLTWKYWPNWSLNHLQKYMISSGSLAAILIHSQFNNSLLQPFILLAWLMILIYEHQVNIEK